MKKFDPKSLPYLSAIAQTVQFGHAGYTLIGWVGVLIGGIIGAVVSFSIAYAGSQIASVHGQKREGWANTSTLILLLLSPLALATPSYISFYRIASIPLRWITACTWALAPDVAILLTGLITGKKLVAAESAPQKPQSAPVAVVKRKSAPAKSHKCELCGMQYTNKGGHYKAHHRKIAVDASLLINKDKEKR